MRRSSLKTLPVEIFHEILDYLDTSTIFSSFYNICQQFNAFLISYNRYKLDLSSISRSDFDLFSCVIHPRNIISLILSDNDQTPGQISLYLSLVHAQELYRLRSLTLLQVEERNLIVFLKYIPIHNLISLSIKWREGSQCVSNSTRVLTLLSSAISQPNLRYLDLNLWNYEIKNLSWPTYCAIQYLQIDHCSFSEFCLILHHSPHLKTLILQNSSMFDINNPYSVSFEHSPYEQLLSLTLENIENIQMNKLEYLLSLTPSLLHLKLIGSGHLRNGAFDGYQWENLIQQHLPFLDKFQFCFTTLGNSDQSIDDVSLLITPFSNSFWIEKKCWFITCDFITSILQIRLYSIPICQLYFEYVPESDIISCSTLITLDNNIEKMNGIRMMSVNLSTAVTEQKDQSISNPVFPEVIELTLEMNNQWSIVSLEFISMLFDLSHLVKISLNIYFYNDPTEYKINAIINLLKQLPNIHTFHSHNNTANAEIICSIVPRHVKYLKVKMDLINDMKMILEQLDQRSSITFEFSTYLPYRSKKFIKWLKQRRTSFTYWRNSSFLHLWLDNNLTRL